MKLLEGASIHPECFESEIGDEKSYPGGCIGFVRYTSTMKDTYVAEKTVYRT